MKNILVRAAAFALALLAAGTASAQMQQGRPGLLGRRPGLNNPGARPGLNGNAPGRAGLNRGANPAAEQGQNGGGGETGDSIHERLENAEVGTNGVYKLGGWRDAPIELLLQSYAKMSGKILLPSPNLPKAQISFEGTFDRELTREEYLEAIEVTLTMHGIVIEPFDDIFIRAFERKSVRTQGIRTSMELPATNAVPEKGRVISQLIRLQHMDAKEAQEAIEGFKDPNGLFQVFQRNNTILVTDTQENINRMLEVIRELDVANPVLEDVFVRQIQYALATDIKTALETIVTESQKETQAASGGTKASGAPGFASARPQPAVHPPRLLLNRPGQQQPPPAPTPNATMLAQVSDADRGMIRGKVLILADERSNKLIVITSKANMDFFDKVIETLDVETTPEVQVEVIRLKYAEADKVASMLNDLIGNGSSSSQSKNNQNQNTQRGNQGNRNLTQQAGNRTAANTSASRAQTANPTFSQRASSSLGELSKDNIKILADERINGIIVMARKADMRAVKEVIEDMDVKLSQVLIETVIIEVTLGDGLNTGIDWVQRGRQHVQVQKTGSFGEPLFYAKDQDGNLLNELVPAGWEQVRQGADGNSYTYKASDVKAMTDTLVRDGLLNHNNYMLGGGGGMGASMLGNLVLANVTNEVVSPIGSGVNYLLKSDKLNLAAVIQATKDDAHAKYIASPIVMTVDNQEAIVEATSARQFLTGWQAVSSAYSGSGMPSPTYTSKDIGIKLTMTPKINPNGTIMLEIKEEYSQVSEKQSMLTPVDQSYTTSLIDVPATRTMESDVVLENRQTVVLGGLVETSTSESETGIPILKDIPWIGKWLFGKVEQTEARKELLVFLTPYVLDDADAAQAEAIRRKKVLSDPRPWEDNGWSLSAVADPVSKKEQLRRLTEEWERQEQERRTAKAIEEAKEKQARKLAEMDEAERKEWALRHQKEIREEQERFEAEQKDLRKIIDQIREKSEQASSGASAPAAEPGSGTATP